MNILDANIPLPERARLARSRLRFRQIGHELLPHRTQDADIVPELHRLGDATFHTRDRDFWRAALCHERYCLAYYDVPLAEDRANCVAARRGGEQAWSRIPHAGS